MTRCLLLKKLHVLIMSLVHVVKGILNTTKIPNVFYQFSRILNKTYFLLHFAAHGLSLG